MLLHRNIGINTHYNIVLYRHYTAYSLHNSQFTNKGIMRHRINVSISPAFYEELKRICRVYGFTNMCEICTGLLSLFIDRVKNAESNRGRKVESNEALIKQMFAEFENWEPTPQPDIIYKRHHRRNVDTYHVNNSKDDEDKPETEITDDRDNEFETDDNGISIYDFDG